MKRLMLFGCGLALLNTGCYYESGPGAKPPRPTVVKKESGIRPLPPPRKLPEPATDVTGVFYPDYGEPVKFHWSVSQDRFRLEQGDRILLGQPGDADRGVVLFPKQRLVFRYSPEKLDKLSRNPEAVSEYESALAASDGPELYSFFTAMLATPCEALQAMNFKEEGHEHTTEADGLEKWTHTYVHKKLRVHHVYSPQLGMILEESYEGKDWKGKRVELVDTEPIDSAVFEPSTQGYKEARSAEELPKPDTGI